MKGKVVKVFVRLIILFMLFIPTMVSAEDYDYSTGALEEDDVSEQEVLEAQLEEQKADKEIETFLGIKKS